MIWLLSALGAKPKWATSGQTAATVTKPAKHSDLVWAIATALDPSCRPAPGSELVLNGVAENPPALAEQPLRILVVDDNPFNQTVASVKLEKLGHQVDVAGGGREAVAEVERRTFDVIFMDMEMPDLDGLAATAEIRRRENGTGRHVPIIAMTAHAIQGIRDRCLRGGMDGYLAKPIEDRALKQILAELTPASKPAEDEQTGDEPAPCPTAATAAVLARVGGNVESLARLVTIFRQDCARLIAEAREALARRDGPLLRTSGHTLKGMVAFFEASVATEAAYRLETLGASGAFDDVDKTLQTLETEIGVIDAQFTKYCEAATT